MLIRLIIEMRRQGGLLLILGGLLTLLNLGGCQSTAPKADSQSAKAAITKQYIKGPVTLKLSLSTHRINTAQFFRLTLQISGPEGYAFELPAAGSATDFGPFTLAGGSKSEPMLTENARDISQQQTYLLEPEGPGEFTLPSLPVSAWDQSKDKASVIELHTEKISLTVESLLTDSKDVTLLDIMPPVTQPPDWFFWVLVALGTLFIVGLAWFFWHRHKRQVRKTPETPPLPFYLIALRALDNLENRNLPAKGEVKQCYAELSGVLRQYIEDHFGLRATEQTTEEFLASMGQMTPKSASNTPFPSIPTLQAQHKRLLRDFLIHCDLVKFAEHKPTAEDIDSAFTLCRQFVNESCGMSSEPENNASGQQRTPPSTPALEMTS